MIVKLLPCVGHGNEDADERQPPDSRHDRLKSGDLAESRADRRGALLGAVAGG